MQPKPKPPESTFAVASAIRKATLADMCRLVPMAEYEKLKAKK